MRTFDNKQKSTQRAKPTSTLKSNRTFPEQHREVHSILHLQRTIGNQAIQRLLAAKTDDAEGETKNITRFGHDFSRIPVYPETHQPIMEERQRRETATPASPILQKLKQTYFSGQVGRASSLVQENLGEGHPLPALVRTQMNRHFGRDLSFVRIHTDEFSSGASKALDANAFTTGHNIVFASGMFRPDTQTGQMRLAHELAHVIQQTGNSTGQHEQLEQQASFAAVLGKPYLQHMGRVAQTIQREPTYPRRATSDQMITEARRVLSLTRDRRSSDETVRMWSNVSSNFGTVTTGSIAR